MSTIQSQISELETKIRQLRSGQIIELQEKLKIARKTVQELEAQIAQITEGAAASVKVALERKKRITSDELKSGIFKALATSPTGMSQKGIADATGFQYPSIALYLKRNAKDFKTTGKSRAKRYFLK